MKHNASGESGRRFPMQEYFGMGPIRMKLLEGRDTLTHNPRSLLNPDSWNVCRREQAPHPSGRKEDHDHGRRLGEPGRDCDLLCDRGRRRAHDSA
jgi:hypothetical protein